MMKNIFAVMVFILSGLLLSGCADSVEEKKIRDIMQTMRQAIQEHDKNSFMKYISPRYHGQDHGNRPVLERFLIQQLKKNKNIYIYIADTNIEVKGDIAKVIFYAGTAGGPDQMPERGQLYRVQTSWGRTSNHWRVINARWRPALSLPSEEKH